MTPIAHLGACIDIVSQAEAEGRVAQWPGAGARMFLGRPDRWYEKPGPLYRCPNDHVSSTVLRSEVRGDLCLACNENVRMTFPEDVDGPLVHPALATCGARSVLGGQCRKPKDHPGRKHSDPGYHDWEVDAP